MWLMPAIAVTDVSCSRKSINRAGDSGSRGNDALDDHKNTSRSGFGYASGRSRTLLMTLKIAVFAPMPHASVRIATAVNAGDFFKLRSA
jgi:hypothetical protein